MDRIVMAPGKQREMLLDFISHNGESQLAAAKLLGVPRRSLRNWLNEQRTIPADLFNKITKRRHSSTNFSEHVREVLDEN